MRNYVEASRVYLDNLNEPESALELLRSAWPHSQQAKDCEEEEFRLLGKFNRHSEAIERLHELIESCPSRRSAGPILVEILGNVAETYPAADIRSMAADLVRREAGSRINSMTSIGASRALAVLRSLAPSDRLLLRDTQRFLAHHYRSPLANPPADLRGGH